VDDPTLGGLFDGWAHYLDHGKPVFHYNFANVTHYNIESPSALTPGEHTIFFVFKYNGGGIGKGGMATLSIDGKQVAQGRIDHTVGVRFKMSVETLDIGEDTGTPVNLSYDVPFIFTGTTDKGHGRSEAAGQGFGSRFEEAARAALQWETMRN
jgi:hypothetical protein